MECPITEIKSVHKESSPNYTNLLINNVFYALSLPRSIGDYIVQATNSHEKFKDALDWIKGATDIDEDRCKCGRPTGVLAIHNHARKALEAEKK